MMLMHLGNLTAGITGHYSSIGEGAAAPIFH